MDSIDLGRAFKAPFADPKWVNKTLMGWLWLLLGVTSPAVFGAQMDYIKGVSEGHEELPEWDNFGDKWVRGFLLMVAYFIYLLPIWILFFILLLPGIIASAATNGQSGGALFGGGMCLFGLLAIVYGIGIAVVMYAATVNYALKRNFGALFALSEILGHIRDGSGYFAAWLWAIVASFAVSVAVSILGATFIGWIVVPAVYYLGWMVMGHLFGQWAQRSYGIVAAAPSYAAPGYIPPTGTYAPQAPPSASGYPQAAPPAAAPTYAPPAYAPPPPPAPPAPPASPAPPAPPAPQAPATPPPADTGFVPPAPTAPVPQPEPYTPPTPPTEAAPPSGEQPPTS